MARALARRYRGRGEPIEDLEQVALLGLVKAVDRFDPEPGIAFPNFAVPTIQGELKRHFRGQWIVRVPRSLQERVLDLGRAIDELTNVARPIADAAASWRGDGRDRGGPARGDGGPARLLGGGAGPPGAGRGRRRRRRRPRAGGRPARGGRAGLLVETLLDRLGPREQMIIRLRFFDELTQSEIAARVGPQPDAGVPADPALAGASPGARRGRPQR